MILKDKLTSFCLVITSLLCYCHTLQAPDTEGTTSEATNYSGCPECASLKKERKKLRRKVRDMDEKISRLKDRLQKNQEDWAISFKELEYQQPVLVTSGVLKTMLSPITYMYCWLCSCADS